MMPSVRRWSFRIVALALLWMVLPGAMEATENLGHLLSSGHLAHAAESGDSHSESGPEHACNATLHLCSCHLTALGLLEKPAPPTASGHADQFLVQVAEHGSSAHLHDIEHPPRS